MSHRPFAAPAVACAAALALGPAPATAESPQFDVTFPNALLVRIDVTYDLLVFVNTTREAYCVPEVVAVEEAYVEWVEGGQQGPPPQYPADLEAAVPLEVTAQVVGQDNLRIKGSATVPVELWTFEEGKSVAAGNLTRPCLDTDGVEDGTGLPIGPGALLAAGEGTYTKWDNDGFVSGPRADVWSDTVDAELSGPAGDYAYRGRVRFVAKDGALVNAIPVSRLRLL